jgi:hypothetical protein
MRPLLFSALMLSFLGIPCAFGDALETGFATMPEQAQLWCYDYWVGDNFSKECITKDLEARKRFGIGESLLGDISSVANRPHGSRCSVKNGGHLWFMPSVKA